MHAVRSSSYDVMFKPRVSGSLLPPCGSMVHVQGKPDVTVMLSSDSSGKTDFSLEDSLVNQASEGSGTEGLIP